MEEVGAPETRQAFVPFEATVCRGWTGTLEPNSLARVVFSLYYSNLNLTSYKRNSCGLRQSYLTCLSLSFLICPKHGTFFLQDLDRSIKEE